MSRVVCWWSDGVASAVATMLTLKEHPEALIVTCDTGAEHPDNLRFRADCERRMDRTVDTLKHDRWKDTWELWDGRSFMSSPKGAICSGTFKRGLRMDFERPGDVQVFGYTADKTDVARAKRMREGDPHMIMATPLIDAGITKANALGIILGLDIEPPATYAMGFPNANCIASGCVKATSPNYWALVRQVSPEGFARTAAIARRIGARLTRIKNVRVFIDDIPADWPTTNPIAPSCDFMCSATQQGLRS